MQKQIIDILKEQNIYFDNITPIGHTKLGRNQVFFISGEQNFIFKVYGKEIKYLYEKKALEKLEFLDQVPKMITSGHQGKLNWIMMSVIEGKLLEPIWDDLDHAEKKNILNSAGLLLGQIHHQESNDYFGGWQDVNPENLEQNYLIYRHKNDANIIEKIRNQQLPENNLFEKAYAELKKLYRQLDPNIKSAICHRDFSFRNMIAENKKGQYEFKGLIDFEHCQMDDPSLDFNTLYQYEMLNDGDLEKSFFDGYETYQKRLEDFEIRKEYYLINLGLHTCSWSYNLAKEFYDNGVQLLQQRIDL